PDLSLPSKRLPLPAGQVNRISRTLVPGLLDHPLKCRYTVITMKLGLGLYRHQLNNEHYAFAKQCGCTHVVIHLVDYFRSSRSNQPGDQPVGDDTGWGLAGDPDKLWTLDELTAIRRGINAAGLELEAIENFDPAHWHDVLLDGPKKQQQLENLKTLI